MYRHLFKPLIEYLIALFGFVLILPFFLLLMIAIKMDSRGPVFFRQNRIGKNKKHFRIFKFRTMRIDTPKDVPTHLLENSEQYITKTGKL